MTGGYIKLHRKLLDWEWIGSPETLCLFVHLLLRAAWEERAEGRTTLRPGQVIIGRRQLAEDTGLSVQQVRTALGHLQSTGEINLATSQGCRAVIVTIRNWEKYQGTGIDAVERHQPSYQPSSTRSDQPSSRTRKPLQNKGCRGQDKENQPSYQPSYQPSCDPMLLNVNTDTCIKELKEESKNARARTRTYGAFVRLTDEEHDRLVGEFGEAFTEACIERLNNYIGSHGDRYKSHYYTIRNWVKDAVREDAERSDGAAAKAGKRARRVAEQNYTQREYTDEQLESLIAEI